MPSNVSGYLVTVRVYLLGGHVIVTQDAFRAEDAKQAENFALNTFIQTAGGAVVTLGGLIVYGGAAIVLDAMCGLEIVSVDPIDLDHPDNADWLESVTMFEQMMDEIDAGQKSNGSWAVDARTQNGQSY